MSSGIDHLDGWLRSRFQQLDTVLERPSAALPLDRTASVSASEPARQPSTGMRTTDSSASSNSSRRADLWVSQPRASHASPDRSSPA